MRGLGGKRARGWDSDATRAEARAGKSCPAADRLRRDLWRQSFHQDRCLGLCDRFFVVSGLRALIELDCTLRVNARQRIDGLIANGAALPRRIKGGGVAIPG